MSPNSPFPGESVAALRRHRPSRTPTTTQVFADIPDDDRAVWERAQAYIDEVGTRMAGCLGCRASTPSSSRRRMGELDLFNDGIDHPDLTRFSPLAAGLVNMEISRGDGSLGTVIAVQGGLALRTLALFGSPEQQARWLRPIAGGEVLGCIRPHRARPRVGLRLARDRGPPRRRRVGAQRCQEVDRQRCVRRHHVRVGARRRRGRGPTTAPSAASSSSRTRRGTPARSIRGKASLRAHPSGAHRPRRRARAAGRGAARRDDRSRMPRPSCTPPARVSPGLRSDTRPPATRPHCRTRSSASIRQAAREVPDGAGAPRADARGTHRDAALLPPPRRPRDRGRAAPHPGVSGEVPQHARGATYRRRRHATSSAATASCSRTASCSTWPTSRPSTPTRAPRACRRC